MAANMLASLSPAVADLGMGLGGMLGEQVSDDTEEMRRKRMALLQQNQKAGQSLAVKSIFGDMGIGNVGY